MSDRDGEKVPDLQGMEDEIANRIGELIDYNAELTQVNRGIARDFMQVASAYGILAGKAREIAELLFEQSKATAGLTYEIIMAESGLHDDEEDDEEEWEEEEDDEGGE